MRINFVSQSKDNNEKDFYGTLANKLNVKSEMMKFASVPGGERKIVKEGLIISYRSNGEYKIKLGNRADIIVTGVAKQEKELQKQVHTALAYLGSMSPKFAKELEQMEADKRNLMVYIDIDRCRDCVWFESDTSHETYRDKCKNCLLATLGGDINNFFPRSHHMLVYTTGWGQIGDVFPTQKKAFQNSLSLLDAHRKGQAKDGNPEMIANEIIGHSKLCSMHGQGINPLCLATHMFEYFKDNKLDFQRIGKGVVDAIEKQSGIQIAIRNGDKTIFAVDKNGLVKRADAKQPDPKFTIEKLEVNDNAKVKIKMKDKSEQSSEENPESQVSKEASVRTAEGITFKPYDRVHLKSDPTVTGTWMETQDSKPGDVDDLVVLDEAFEGHHVIEITPMELEADGVEVSEEQKAFADNEFDKYKSQMDVYDEGFNDKVEVAIEDRDLNEKAASVRTAKENCVPGALKPPQVKALEDYEKAKDNYPKSKEIMPKDKSIEPPKLPVPPEKIASFEGTLCIAQVK